MEDIEKTKAYRNGGKVFKEVYSSDRMEELKKIIEKIQSSGRSKKFSISVDNEVVVPITNEVEDFDSYLDFLSLHTKVIEVRLYFGSSPNSNRHLFYLKDESLGGLTNQNFAGADMDTRIQEALDKQRLETEVVSLRKKLKSKKRRIEELEELLTKEPEEKVDMNSLMDKGVQLFGLFQQQKGGALPMQGTPEETVKIEREISPAQQAFDQLKEKYSDKLILEAIDTWSYLCANPEEQQQFAEFLKSKNN